MNRMIIYGARSVFSSLISFICVSCLVLIIIGFYELRWLDHYDHVAIMNGRYTPKFENRTDHVYAVYGRNIESGYLKHVFEVFNAYGYAKREIHDDDWDVLWAHDYPFQKLFPTLKLLKRHQKVNHFPGTGFITNKMDLATTDVHYIPKAFKMPNERKKFLNYVSKNPEKMFVQKSNNHRGIQVKHVDELDLEVNDIFIQEFISNPLLIDGYKFDVGVYTIITSVEPLRVYIYNGDMIFRFCTEKYFPFDKNNVKKYVIGDDYRPIWEVPSLKKFVLDYGFSMKISFDEYLRQSGRNPEKIWLGIEDAIRIICLKKEQKILKALQKYPSKRNFFEMMRFDFAVDDDLNVFIMEANMSPNLSSAHYPRNRLLYMQVLFNLFSLVGLNSPSTRNRKTEDMEVSLKNLMVFPEACSKQSCNSCFSPECHLCLNCLTSVTINYLKDAYAEYNRREDCKRIFPPTIVPSDVNGTVHVADDYSPENQIMINWFKGKCLLDSSWC